MAVWLIRAGAHGEYEQKFMQKNLRAELPLKRIWMVAAQEAE